MIIENKQSILIQNILRLFLVWLNGRLLCTILQLLRKNHILLSRRWGNSTDLGGASKPARITLPTSVFLLILQKIAVVVAAVVWTNLLLCKKLDVLLIFLEFFFAHFFYNHICHIPFKSLGIITIAVMVACLIVIRCRRVVLGWFLWRTWCCCIVEIIQKIFEMTVIVVGVIFWRIPWRDIGSVSSLSVHLSNAFS